MKILKKIYRKKQAGKVWNDYLKGKLLKLWFSRSIIDERVFNCDCQVFLVYVYDIMFVSLGGSYIDETIKELQHDNTIIDDQGYPEYYIGVNIIKLSNNSYEFTQPELTR